MFGSAPCAWLAVGLSTWLRHTDSAAAGGLLVPGGLVLLLPSSSILPAADLAADRRMYLPMIGFATAAALLVQRARPAVLGAMLVLLARFQRTAHGYLADRAVALAGRRSESAGKCGRKSNWRARLNRCVPSKS